MGVGCGAALGAVHPWRGEAEAMLGGSTRPALVVLPCFGAEGGRRGRWGQKAEQAGRAAGSTGLKPEEETFSK
jgi:hypothetical protein